MLVNLIDVSEKATSSFTEASIRYSECSQKLIDAYPDDLYSNLLLSFSSFTHIFDISLVQQKLQKLDSVMLNKVIVEYNMECTFPNVEISLRIFLTLMVTSCTTERSFSQMNRIKKSKENNDETREAGILISAHDRSRFVVPN